MYVFVKEVNRQLFKTSVFILGNINPKGKPLLCEFIPFSISQTGQLVY